MPEMHVIEMAGCRLDNRLLLHGLAGSYVMHANYYIAMYLDFTCSSRKQDIIW